VRQNFRITALLLREERERHGPYELAFGDCLTLEPIQAIGILRHRPGTTLTATSLSKSVSLARYTSAMPRTERGEGLVAPETVAGRE
jgi:hypothetical protein